MKSPKPEIPTYSMPLADLLEVLGATRRSSERPPRAKRDRRPPREPITPPDEQPESDA
jgi:hypothetical protein